MSTISVPISEDDLFFLRRYTSDRGASVEELMAEHVRNLRRSLEGELHPDIINASGTFLSVKGPVSRYYKDQEEKHR